MLGLDQDPVADAFLGSSFFSPLVAWAAEPTSDNGIETVKAYVQDVGTNRNPLALVAKMRLGPEIQTLNTKTVGPKLGSTVVGKELIGRYGTVVKLFEGLPLLSWEAAIGTFSLAMCAR
jgi:hypothetical protein